MAIHPKDIGAILEISYKARGNGKRLIPCFRGPSGIGKSQAVHQWVEQMNKKTVGGFRMIDFRGATIDASDTRGLPWKDEKTGQTVFLPPDFLPTSGSGLLFIDEINRSATPVQNCFMELFTEDRIGNYILPPGWAIVTAINPGDNDSYDVNSMDAALRNRVIEFDVKFDHKSFVAYAERKEWSPFVVRYLRTSAWVYREPTPGEHYIAPRSWEFLSDAEIAGAMEDPDIHSEICVAILGKNIGLDYWNFCHKQKPIFYADLEKALVQSKQSEELFANSDTIREFAAYANTQKAKSYRADLITATVQSIIDFARKNPKLADGVNPIVLKQVCMLLPADQVTALIQEISMTVPDPHAWIMKCRKQYPDLFSRLRNAVLKEGVKTGE